MSNKTRSGIELIHKASNEDIEDAFLEAFMDQIGSHNNIDEIDCKCTRNTSGEIKMEVTVIGLAGSPTIDDYKAGKVKNSKNVAMPYAGGICNFKILPKEIAIVNSTDFSVMYKAE